jgi:hypothetical protein
MAAAITERSVGKNANYYTISPIPPPKPQQLKLPSPLWQLHTAGFNHGKATNAAGCAICTSVLREESAQLCKLIFTIANQGILSPFAR